MAGKDKPKHNKFVGGLNEIRITPPPKKTASKPKASKPKGGGK